MNGLDITKAEEVRIDVRDWRDETLQDEALVTSRDDVLEMVAQGVTTGKIVKRAVISELLGVAPTAVLRPHKLLFYSGAQLAVAQLARSTKRAVKVANGKEYQAARFVGRVNHEVLDDQGKGTGVFQAVAQTAGQTAPAPSLPDTVSYADMDDSKQHAGILERAQNYLRGIVPGHIWDRLLAVYQCGGDVQSEADKLKDAIDEMVVRITAGKEE